MGTPNGLSCVLWQNTGGFQGSVLRPSLALLFDRTKFYPETGLRFALDRRCSRREREHTKLSRRR
jgi:hypothetical protein